MSVRLPARSLYALTAAAAASLAACAPSGSALAPARTDADPQPRRVATPQGDNRPALMVDGAGLSREQLWPALAEAAGGVVIEEAALELLLNDRCRREGVSVTDADVARERELLAASLSEDPDEAERLLREVRRRRALGDHRFASLLRRNAMLRALVRPDVQLNDAMTRQAYDLRYGPRLGARIIVTPTLASANEALQRIRAGEVFAEVAASTSVDPSAQRGGLIEPVSPSDPAFPQGVRSALQRLDPGAVSQPIAVDGGFAILRREPDPASAEPPPFDAVRAQAERDALLRQQRILMEELARSILRDASITPFDPPLAWSWSQTTGR